MGSTTRSLTVAVRVDASNVDAGFKDALKREKEFAAEAASLNKKIADAREGYQKAKAGGADSGEVAKRKEALVALRAERAAFVDTARLKSRLDDEYFKSTHTRDEIMLRDKRLYYDRLREMHKNNADMMMRISRNEAADIAQIQSTIPIGKRASRTNRIGILELQAAGVNSVQALAAGMSPARVATMESMQVAGGLLQGGMVGLPALLGAAVPVMGLLAIHQQETAQAKQLADAEKALMDARKESAAFMRSLTPAPTTAQGSQIESRIEAEKKQLSDSQTAMHDAEDGNGLFSHLASVVQQHNALVANDPRWFNKPISEAAKGMNWLMGWKNDPNAPDAQEAIINARSAEVTAHQNEIIKLQKMRDAEKRIAESRRNEDVTNQIADSGLLLMSDGPAKSRASLAIRQRDETLKLQREHQDRTRMMEANSATTPQEREEEQRRQSQETLVLNVQHGAQILAQERQFEDDRHQLKVSADQAEISLIKDDYDREMAMLKNKHVEEYRQYVKAGKDVTDLLRRQAAEEAQVKMQQRKWVESQLASISPAVARQQFMTHVNDASRAGQMTAAERAIIINAHDNGTLQQEIKRGQMQLEFMQGKISRTQLLFQQTVEAHPFADKSLIWDKVQQQLALDNMNHHKSSDGFFGTQYTAGMFNFRYLNLGFGSKDEKTLLQQILNELKTIAKHHPLN